MVIEMKCKKCGANLLDTDQFCDQCGWKVVRERRCPECNAPLREGTKFCPKCGTLIGGTGKAGAEKRPIQETTEIPIADIEQNILFETEREIHKSEKDGGAAKVRRTVGAADDDFRTERTAKAARTDKASRERTASTGSAPKKRAAGKEEEDPYRMRRAVPAPEPKPKRKERPAPVKKKIYEEWDDDDEDDEDDEEGFSFMTIVSVFMAFVILAVAVFLIFSLQKNRAVKNYGEAEQENVGGEEGEDSEGNGAEGSGENGTEAEDGNAEESEPGTESDVDIEIMETDEIQASGALAIIKDVNVRDNPSTEGTNILKVAKAGEVYEYIGMTKDESWYHIRLEDGTAGYVSAKFVSPQ